MYNAVTVLIAKMMPQPWAGTIVQDEQWLDLLAVPLLLTEPMMPLTLRPAPKHMDVMS